MFLLFCAYAHIYLNGLRICAHISKLMHFSVSLASSSDVIGCILRRCFAHTVRCGFTRGGGKRGGKGSLPRYLLDQGVIPRVVVKMMSLILLFNYVPNAIIYKHAMTLFLHEFRDHVNPHICCHYLDPTKPHLLGGRAVGPQGAVGSNNGGEKAGGKWQSQGAAVIRRNPGDKGNNFMLLIEGTLDSLAATVNFISH